jgi:hypothetical protein
MEEIRCVNITKFHYTTTNGENGLLVKIEPKPYTKQKCDLNFVTTLTMHHASEGHLHYVFVGSYCKEPMKVSTERIQDCCKHVVSLWNCSENSRKTF